jgi:CRISPR-associated protein Cst2
MSVAFRLGLGFHALNNEGADGSNLMQPRRIDVGELTYDGISGEIIRRHILENFVSLCARETPRIDVLPLSAGLHPDRGPIGIRAAARVLGHTTLTSENLYSSAREAIRACAVLDVGGFLAAFGQEAASDNDYVAEGAYLRDYCAAVGAANPVKRETCFDVGWLISEEPQDLTVTQHSAFRDTAALNSRYAQTVRSNVYGGVIRADLHRVGTDDHWYLLGEDRLAVEPVGQQRRQAALINAIVNFIAAPTGAKTAAWAPHIFLTEGVILLTSARTAPFTSPIQVDLRTESRNKPVSANPGYISAMTALNNSTDTWTWTFNNVQELITAGGNAATALQWRGEVLNQRSRSRRCPNWCGKGHPTISTPSPTATLALLSLRAPVCPLFRRQRCSSASSRLCSPSATPTARRAFCRWHISARCLWMRPTVSSFFALPTSCVATRP